MVSSMRHQMTGHTRCYRQRIYQKQSVESWFSSSTGHPNLNCHDPGDLEFAEQDESRRGHRGEAHGGPVGDEPRQASADQNALKEAAKILIHHFMLFSDEKITLETEERSVTEEFDENTLHVRQLLKTKLVDLDLSVRALNCLKAADVETLGELVAYNRNDLLKFRNFGKKSLAELDELVMSKNLEFGMNTTKYKLDKD